VAEPFALRLFEAKSEFANLFVGAEQYHASAFSIVACRQYIWSWCT
jgi:hypothetical protein